jgi:exosortase
VKLEKRTVLFVLSTLALVAFQWQAIRDLITYAESDKQNASQVLLIPFVSAALIFWDRKKIFARVQYSVFPAVLMVMLGVGLLLAARLWVTPIHEGDRIVLMTASTLTIWLGLFVGFFGVDAFRAALFPLLFLLFFTIPIPELILKPLISFLQRGSAEISFVLLRLTGTPVYREGFIFLTSFGPIEIAPECSGIRSFLSMLILTILAGHLLLQTTWRRIALVLVAIPIMIFKNAVRIVTLTLLSIHVDPAIIESRLHREGGIPFFLLALLLTYPILKILMKTEKAERSDAGEQSILREANL